MRIRLFGAVLLDGDAGEVSPGPPAQKKLLALLALRVGHTVPVDRIIEDMWGEEAPANAEQIVRTYVSRLRKILEPQRTDGEPPRVLTTDSGGYRLRLTEDDVDVLKFQRLVEDGQSTGEVRRFLEAERLWRDEALTEFPYDDFAVHTRDRLDMLRLDAVEHRLALEIEPPVSTAALDELRELVDSHPLRENLWQLLMTALYRTGRQTEALRVYDQARRRLAEVGLEPGPALRDLEAAIAGQDEALLASDRVVTLPSALDTFIGRAEELATLTERLDAGRLVTIVGAGGSGKTRLALETARSWSSGLSAFVDLAPVAGGQGVVEALLDSLGEPQRHSSDPLAAATRILSDGNPLVVFDNCEHVLDPVASVVERLLAECPTLRTLTTSREALRARGEALLHLHPMSLPDTDDPAVVADSDAGRLFIERAASADPGFLIADDTAKAVATIVRCVDGIPLAIEMAAVQLHTTDVDHLAASLQDVFAGLGAGRRTALPRHRTLRATLDWSYQLLDVAAQRLFRRLAVLPTDFDAEVAPAFGASAVDLERLAATSMIARVPHGRYRMLVPVRQFAATLLDAAGERSDAEAERNAHFTELAATLGQGFRRDGEATWHERFAADRINIVGAVDALRITDPERSAVLIAGLLPYLARMGLYSEATRLGDQALRDGSDPEVAAEIHNILAWAASHAGDYEGSEAHVARLLERGDDDRYAARALNQHGSVLAQRGYMLEADRVFADLVEKYERVRPEEWFVPVVNHCSVLAWKGDLERAGALLHRLERAKAAGEIPDEMSAYIAALAGIRARMSGSLEDATIRLEEAAQGFLRHGPAFHHELSLVERAIALHELGSHIEAEALAEAVVAASSDRDVVLYPRVRALILLGAIAFDGGDLVGAGRFLRSGLEAGLGSDDAGAVVHVAETAAELALALGDDDTAHRLLAWVDARRIALGLARDAAEAERRERLGTPATPTDVPGDQKALDLLDEILGSAT